MGKTSIVVDIDTLGTVPVVDSLFSGNKWPRFDLATLQYVPGTDPPVEFDNLGLIKF